MTKYWEPGRVKTRLAQSLMEQPQCAPQLANSHADKIKWTTSHALQVAAQLHKRFVKQLLGELAECGDAREIVGAPADSLPALRQAANARWKVVDQGTGDLGERMKQWFTRLLTPNNTDSSGRNATKSTRPWHSIDEPLAPAAKAILIGSDCPLLTASEIQDAWDCLDNHDIVLGPAIDGGYYLIGIAGEPSRGQLDSVFDGIAWSTDKVFEQTLGAVQSLGWPMSTLPPRRDIDRASDLWELLIDRPSNAAKSEVEFRQDLIGILNS